MTCKIIQNSHALSTGGCFQFKQLSLSWAVRLCPKIQNFFWKTTNFYVELLLEDLITNTCKYPKTNWEASSGFIHREIHKYNFSFILVINVNSWKTDKTKKFSLALRTSFSAHYVFSAVKYSKCSRGGILSLFLLAIKIAFYFFKKILLNTFPFWKFYRRAEQNFSAANNRKSGQTFLVTMSSRALLNMFSPVWRNFLIFLQK